VIVHYLLRLREVCRVAQPVPVSVVIISEGGGGYSITD